MSETKEITPARVREYIAADGQFCPFCGNHEISGASVQIESATAWQEVTCADCNNQWQDVYDLARIDFHRDDGEFVTVEPPPVEPAPAPEIRELLERCYAALTYNANEQCRRNTVESIVQALGWDKGKLPWRAAVMEQAKG